MYYIWNHILLCSKTVKHTSRWRTSGMFCYWILFTIVSQLQLFNCFFDHGSLLIKFGWRNNWLALQDLNSQLLYVFFLFFKIFSLILSIYIRKCSNFVIILVPFMMSSMISPFQYKLILNRKNWVEIVRYFSHKEAHACISTEKQNHRQKQLIFWK